MDRRTKLIFLDIDGVMVHGNHFVRSEKHQLQEFCPRAVANLKQIIKETAAKIIVSSSWRRGYTVNSIRRELFRHYDLHFDVIGLTPILSDESIRGEEIAESLSRCVIPVEKFVIIDDDDDMGDLLPHLVKTSWFEGGLNDQVRDEVIKILS